MDLDTVSDKHLHELERLSKELLALLKKGKLTDLPLAESLRLLQAQAEKARHARFDDHNKEFQGF
jgi:ribosomal 50S subunit-associated protein YjgA (DUF615 family)